jgi:hypothetical protein
MSGKAETHGKTCSPAPFSRWQRIWGAIQSFADAVETSPMERHERRIHSLETELARLRESIEQNRC